MSNGSNETEVAAVRNLRSYSLTTNICLKVFVIIFLQNITELPSEAGSEIRMFAF